MFRAALFDSPKWKTIQISMNEEQMNKLGFHIQWNTVRQWKQMEYSYMHEQGWESQKQRSEKKSQKDDIIYMKVQKQVGLKTYY